VLKRLGKAFDEWAAEEAVEHEEAKATLKALTILKDKVLELTGKTDTAEALGVLALALNQCQELVTLKAKIADERAKGIETEFSATVDAAVAQGKLAPAGPVSKEFFVGLKADIGTEKALAALKKAIPAEPIVQLRAPTEPTPAAAVSAAQVQIASMCGGRFGGLDQFKAQREAELKGGAGAPTT
jgi:cell division protein ZapA (FtsZ GTPase activity inhibitor)